MIIHLPKELESAILAQVQSGRFASLNEAMTQAAHLLIRQLEKGDQPKKPVITFAKPDSVCGSRLDESEEVDEKATDPVKKPHESWRVIGGE